MAKGTPDTIYYVLVHTFFLESKVWPNRPKNIQWYKIETINEKGGSAWAITLKGDQILLETKKNEFMPFKSISLAIEWIIFYLSEKVKRKLCSAS